MSISQYVRILWARKWVFIALFILVSGVGILHTLKQPKRYLAEVSMLVEVRADPILGAMAPGLATPVFMATQVEMIRSDRVANKVVKLLGIDKAEGAVQAWMEATQGKTSIENYYGGILLAGLTVEPARGTNFLTIGYTAPDPKFAAAAANAFSRGYLDVAVDLRVEPARQYAAWFDEQSKVLRADLEQAQAKLSKYQQDKGITDERLEQETARLNILIGQLATAQAERADASSRLGVSGGEASPDVQQSGAVQALRGQLTAAQTKLTEISNIVGSNHPQRLALEAQIAEIRQQLAAEMRRVSGSTSAVSRASGRKLAELQGLVDAQKARVLSMKSSRDDIQVLVRDVENAQRAYDAVVARANQTGIESEMTQTNVSVLKRASPPVVPSSPRLLLNTAIAVALGLLLGLGAALARELADKRLRSENDVLGVLRQPLIGVLPVRARIPLLGRSRARLQRLRILGARPSLAR